MTGIEYLEGFPEEIKEQIITEYGSLIDLYQMIFELNSQQYKLYQVKPLEKQKIFAIRNKLFDIEDKLEEFGIEDGRDVTTEVSSDFGEFMTKAKPQLSFMTYFSELIDPRKKKGKIEHSL